MAPWIPPNSQPVPYCPQIGADADFRAPMAIAVIGGLITSTLLSLFYVPIVFTYVDDLKQWLTRSHKLQTRTA
jgi:Cu/Ag efflux pump CusA